MFFSWDVEVSHVTMISFSYYLNCRIFLGEIKGIVEAKKVKFDVFTTLQVEKNQSLCQVLSLPEHKSSVVSVDWSSSMSCYTCLTGSVDGFIQVTSLLKH